MLSGVSQAVKVPEGSWCGFCTHFGVVLHVKAEGEELEQITPSLISFRDFPVNGHIMFKWPVDAGDGKRQILEGWGKLMPKAGT